ncbi:MAG: hypothetical protein IPJ77_05110 [Planctomycetes bacterium]|nr:hypothetical protein [Planctomycetota bacterium]
MHARGDERGAQPSAADPSAVRPERAVSRLLLVGGTVELVAAVHGVLQRRWPGVELVHAAHGDHARAALERDTPSAICIRFDPPYARPMSLLRRLRAMARSVPILALGSQRELAFVDLVLRSGASLWLVDEPFVAAELEQALVPALTPAPRPEPMRGAARGPSRASLFALDADELASARRGDGAGAPIETPAERQVSSPSSSPSTAPVREPERAQAAELASTAAPSDAHALQARAERETAPRPRHELAQGGSPVPASEPAHGRACETELGSASTIERETAQAPRPAPPLGAPLVPDLGHARTPEPESTRTHAPDPDGTAELERAVASSMSTTNSTSATGSAGATNAPEPAASLELVLARARRIVLVPIGARGLPDASAVLRVRSLDVAAGALRATLDGWTPLAGGHALAAAELGDARNEFAWVEHDLSASAAEGRCVLRLRGTIEDLLDPARLEPVLDATTMRYRYGHAEELVAAWCELGVLVPELVDRVLVCPRCEALPTIRLGCRQCGSARIECERLIHHFACANVARASEYETAQGLVCPKCRARELVVNADYEYLSGPWDCRDCGYQCGERDPVCHCLVCAERFFSRDASELELVAYHAARMEPLALLAAP